MSLLDRLYEVDLDVVKRALMAWLTVAQTRDPAVLITGTGIMFLALCRRFGIEPRRALEVAERVTQRAQERNTAEVRAMNLYMEHEI